MNIPLHRIDKSLPLPQYETAGSFAFDFVARERTEIGPKDVGFVPGNVIIECPPNLALLILPRSSLFRKKSLLIPNAPGLVDQDYCGKDDEILIQVLNLSEETVVVDRGEKIAQGLFVRTERAAFEEHDSPREKSRGGFGSTDTP